MGSQSPAPQHPVHFTKMTKIKIKINNSPKIAKTLRTPSNNELRHEIMIELDLGQPANNMGCNRKIAGTSLTDAYDNANENLRSIPGAKRELLWTNEKLRNGKQLLHAFYAHEFKRKKLENEKYTESLKMKNWCTTTNEGASMKTMLYCQNTFEIRKKQNVWKFERSTNTVTNCTHGEQWINY